MKRLLIALLSTAVLFGCDPPVPCAAGVTSLAEPVTITDTTVVSQLGWPTAFSIAEVAPADQIRAYRITVPAGQTLDKLGLIAGVAGGDFSLALYTEAATVPGTLVASTVRTTLSAAGRRDVELADAPIAAGTYYVAMRAEPSVSLLRSSSATARLCTRTLTNLATAWPASFGAATCSTTTPVNLFAITFSQP